MDERIISSCEALLERIGLPAEAAEAALRYPLTEREARAQHDLLRADPGRFLAENDARPGAPLRYLALFCAFAPVYREECLAQGISERIAIDTLRDVPRWEAACFAHTGRHGITEQGWLVNHFGMKLFALGELQFEPLDAPEFPVPPELAHLRTFNVHIPKGANLDLRQASYDQALSFFGVERALGVCHSWLLSPALRELLPERSRIRDFQSEFCIAGLDEESRQAEERIFDAVLDDPAQYPADTSLQRAARARLLSGARLPAAFGYRVLERV